MTPDRYEDITYELNHELGNLERREIDRRVEHAQTVCHCHVVEDPWTYYGIAEPGGAMEPDVECPVHFPADATEER